MTTDSANTIDASSETVTSAASSGATTSSASTPRFEQTMQGLLAMLQALPRDIPVTNGMLVDWVLPLFEDARDEYHALTSDNLEQISSLADDVASIEQDREPAGVDEGARRVVIAAIGLAAMAYKRSGWLDDDFKTTSKCPKDLADEYARVQKFVEAWMSGVDIVTLTEEA